MTRELIKPSLLEEIKKYSPQLNFPQVFLVDDTLEPVNPLAFLAAFSLNESSGGWNTTPRYEPAYGPGGRYFNTPQKKLYDMYGEDACKSYGSYQIMFIIYHELGFINATPQIAGEDWYQLPVVIKYFNRRVFRWAHLGEPNFLGMAGDAYNSGTWKDKNVPEVYIKRLIKHYHDVKKYLGIPTPAFNKPWDGNVS